MSGVYFTKFQCHDDMPALSQEEGLRRILGFAGILDVTANSAIDDPMADTTLLSAYRQRTWTANGVMTGNGTGTALTDVTVAAAGLTFTRVAGSFIADGFQVGGSAMWAGFAKAGTTNNGTFVITTLTALVMTCSAATLSDEVPADYVSVTATPALWYSCLWLEEIEPGFVATFTKTGNTGGFVFNANSSYSGYLVWWTGTNVGVSKLGGTGGGTPEKKLISLPCTETGTAGVTVAVYPLRYSDIDTIDDVTVSLWFDGKLLLSFVIPYDMPGKMVGFSVYGNNTATFDDLHIPQFHQFSEWVSVDPGEQASAGMARILGLDKIKIQARWDGSAYIWRNNEVTVDWAIPESRPASFEITTNLYPPSHLRFTGAVHEADIFRAGTQGHVFAIGNDPNALSQGDTYLRADRKLVEITESAKQAELRLDPNPFLEAEDVFSYAGVSYRVSTIAYQINWVGDRNNAVPVLISNVTARLMLDEYEEIYTGPIHI